MILQRQNPNNTTITTRRMMNRNNSNDNDNDDEQQQRRQRIEEGFAHLNVSRMPRGRRDSSHLPMVVGRSARHHGYAPSVAASSITFSEVSSNDTGDLLDLHPFLNNANEEQDHMPGRPTRRVSLAPSAVDGLEAQPATVKGSSDNAPLRPTRQFSLVPTPHNNSRNAPPTQPTRQVSLPSTSEKSESVVDDNGSSHMELHNNKKLDGSRRSSSSSNTTTNTARKKNPLQDSFTSESTSSSTEPLPEYLQPSFQSDLDQQLLELKEKAATFQQIVQTQDRKYGMRTYKDCFVGEEAVTAMLEHGLATTRSDAVELGRNFMKFLNLFQHVVEDHTFKDKYLFFRFCDSPHHLTANNHLAAKKSKKMGLSLTWASQWGGKNNNMNSINSLTASTCSNKSVNPWYCKELHDSHDIIFEEGSSAKESESASQT